MLSAPPVVRWEPTTRWQRVKVRSSELKFNIRISITINSYLILELVKVYIFYQSET